jgi:hypothetical protein
MKSLLFIIAIAISSLAFSQTSARISFSTGDVDIEAHLNDVNSYASADISVFRNDLAFRFKASDSELDLYLVKERMRPADVYYGYVISYTTGRPFPEVIKMYKKKKGWGSIARDLGIKPGSDKFHALKNNTLRSIEKDKMKGGKKNRTSISGSKKNKNKNK